MKIRNNEKLEVTDELFHRKKPIVRSGECSRAVERLKAGPVDYGAVLNAGVNTNLKYTDYSFYGEDTLYWDWEHAN